MQRLSIRLKPACGGKRQVPSVKARVDVDECQGCADCAGEIVVDAYATETPGLFVHRWHQEPKTTWAVTTASGALVEVFKTKKAGKALADQLDKVAEWEDPNVSYTAEIYNKVMEVYWRVVQK